MNGLGHVMGEYWGGGGAVRRRSLLGVMMMLSLCHHRRPLDSLPSSNQHGSRALALLTTPRGPLAWNLLCHEYLGDIFEQILGSKIQTKTQKKHRPHNHEFDV